jgi:hypothetical protein
MGGGSQGHGPGVRSSMMCSASVALSTSDSHLPASFLPRCDLGLRIEPGGAPRGRRLPSPEGGFEQVDHLLGQAPPVALARVSPPRQIAPRYLTAFAGGATRSADKGRRPLRTRS